MTTPATPSATVSRLASPPVVRLSEVRLRYGNTVAVDGVTLDLPAGCMVGLIGPDGVGKSSLLSQIAGARKVQQGRVEVLGGDMADRRHRAKVLPQIAYMPQGLGKNLYPTLSVFENADFFGRLFGHSKAESKRRITDLLESIGMGPFTERPAGKLSGGMKQKLSLCCSLIHDPDLLILDEPTTGVDPLSRRQFWELIDRIRAAQPNMSVLVATAYMDEAQGFDWLVVMNDGRVLATGTPQELLSCTSTTSLEEAFIELLPKEKRQGHTAVHIPPREPDDGVAAIEARDLTKRFGDFVAVNQVTFRIERGEIFGFLGSNGCGKTTTMKILTGLLPASEGKAWLLGHEVDAEDIATRRRVGYMSQSFSLYSELTVHQNLVLHARLFQMPADKISTRVKTSAERFGLEQIMNELPSSLPLGLQQRLSLAVALIHEPELLILDEPTSGVDPVARDDFWRLLIDLSRNDKVTIFISTHFMNEAQRCDRISLMHAGKVLISDTPTRLVEKRGSANLEEAFISYLEEASDESPTRERGKSEQPRSRVGLPLSTPATKSDPAQTPEPEPAPGSFLSEPAHEVKQNRFFSFQRMMSYARRETLELSRDPIRATLAGLGTVILMFIMGYGIGMDVEDLTFAVLDRDQTTISRDYILNLSGSRYFIEHSPIADYEELDRRMRSGELSLAIEIPSSFGRDVGRGKSVQIGVWMDGAMPRRAETIRGYVQGMHLQWLSRKAAEELGAKSLAGPATIETRFRYNPDVKSLVAMVPAVIPLLLMMIPAMLATLSVVREKELGSIINFYVTPTTRLEFLIGKQMPYVVMAMLNFFLLVALAVTLFGVPMKGSFLAASVGGLLYVICATAMGLLISTFMRSQVAAVFGTTVITLLPATLFSGMIDPVSSLEGVGALIGNIYPTAHFLTISRGTFSKALGFSDLQASFTALAISVPVLLGLGAALLKKQEG